MLPTTPRGPQTSEFWLIVAAGILTIARSIATSLGLHFSPGADAQLNIATALPAIYAALRTYLKIHVPTVGNALPDLPDVPFAPSYDPAPTEQPPLTDSTPPAADTPTITVNAVPSAT